VLNHANYPCGCKVRAGIDPVDGKHTMRLYGCGPRATDECLYAKAVVATLEELAEEDPDATMEQRVVQRGELPIPLTPYSDDPPEEVTEERSGGTPGDLHLTCGCSCYCGIGETGERRMSFFACSKGRECRNAKLIIRLAESSGMTIEVRGG